MRRLAIVGISLAAPACLAAQPFARTPVPFTGLTRSYALSGCGDGYLSSDLDGPRARIFCLTGTATVGLAQDPRDGRFYQTVLDLRGTRESGFDGTFTDADYSAVVLNTRYEMVSGAPYTPPTYFGVSPDLTGHAVFGYFLGFVPTEDVAPNGITFGEPGAVYLAYYPAGAPRSIDDRFNLSFSLAVTAVPEPASLALTLGGLAVFGVGVWRRRQKGRELA